MECIIQNPQYVPETSVNEDQVSAVHIYILVLPYWWYFYFKLNLFDFNSIL